MSNFAPSAVKTAIEAQFSAEATDFLFHIRSILRRDFINSRDANDTVRLIDECDALTQPLVDATKGDIELLRALDADGCALAQKLLLENALSDYMKSDENVVAVAGF